MGWMHSWQQKCILDPAPCFPAHLPSSSPQTYSSFITSVHLRSPRGLPRHRCLLTSVEAFWLPLPPLYVAHAQIVQLLRQMVGGQIGLLAVIRVLYSHT